METAVAFTVLETDREAALAVVRGSMRVRGHRIEERADGSFTATRGNRVLTTAFGAIVPEGHRFRRYEVRVTDGAGSATLTLRAAHGAAVAGGSADAIARRRAWNLTVDGVECGLSVAGMLVHRQDRAPEPV